MARQWRRLHQHRDRTDPELPKACGRHHRGKHGLEHAAQRSGLAAEANFDNPTVSNGAFETGYGGTSFAAPRWAGFLALVNQQSVADGHGTVGFVNPALYALGVAKGADFHDIVSGNNKPGEGGGSGFNASAGYDLVTGWAAPTEVC